MTTQFVVPDATCGHCKQTIEGAVSKVEGVDGAELDLESKHLTIQHADGIEAALLEKTIADAGYSPEPVR